MKVYEHRVDFSNYMIRMSLPRHVEGNIFERLCHQWAHDKGNIDRSGALNMLSACRLRPATRNTMAFNHIAYARARCHVSSARDDLCHEGVRSFIGHFSQRYVQQISDLPYRWKRLFALMSSLSCFVQFFFALRMTVGPSLFRSCFLCSV